MAFIQIKDRDEILQALKAESIKDEDSKSIWATISVLLDGAVKKPLFSLASQTLLSSESKANLQDDSVEFLGRLTKAARGAAAELVCSSIVAGRGSESDEHGDVAFWAGEIDDERKEEGTIEALGLDHLLEVGEIIPGGGTGDHSLSSLNAIPAKELEAGKAAMVFSKLLSEFEDALEFTVELPDNKEGVTLHFFAGKWHGGWCGLIGAGVEGE